MAEPCDMPFPTEVFQLIVELSLPRTRRTLLFVSKMFHDLALPTLFSHISLRFGVVRKPGRRWEVDSRWTDQELARLSHFNERSLAVLHHILKTPALATVVRTLSVCSYEFPNPQASSVALRALGAAIEALPLLESFSWRGTDARPPQFVAEALLKCPRLHSILIPPYQAIWPELASLNRLTSITLHVSRTEWIPSVSMSPENSDATARALSLIESNAANLESLTVSYALFPASAGQCALPALKHATFLRATSGVGLSALLASSPTALTTLTLTADAWNLDGIIAVLASAPDEAFPALSAFKFLVDYTREPHDCDANVVVRFLRPKKRLRRLHLGLYSELSQPVIRMLPELPQLEALGLGWGGMMFTAENAGVFERCLPTGLRALIINVDPESEEAMDAFTRVVKRLPQLIACFVPHPGDIATKLVRALLADPGQALQLVGDASTLYYVCRADPTWSLSPSLCTSDLDPKLTMADYGLEDWLWLAQHRMDFGELDLGNFVLDLPACKACGTNAGRHLLLDCVDLHELEGSCYVLSSRTFGL